MTGSSRLFSPLSLGPLRLDNRIVVSPMCQYSADEGRATDWHIMHLGSLSHSGAGLMFTEATAVEATGRITYADLGLYDDATEEALGRVLQAVRKYSHIPVGIQLAHAGRKASTHTPWDGGAAIAPDAPRGWQTLGPSARGFHEGDPLPRAASDTDIAAVVKSFADSAKRADRLGFDAVEVHGAHGYLLHEFLSPLANDRTDNYGGSFDNRTRLLLRVFDTVRDVIPASKPVGVRLSATDWVDGGWDLDQSTELAKMLDGRGCSFIDVSSGGASPLQKIALGPGYQVPFAAAIKKAVSMPVVAVGLITDAEQAEQIIAAGEADAVALARAMLYDPRWPWHAAAKLGATILPPVQYERSAPREVKGLFRRR